jgi:hypothetical protein
MERDGVFKGSVIMFYREGILKERENDGNS